MGAQADCLLVDPILNLLVIIALLAVGIPGFHGATKVVNWVLGLLLIHHVITNNGRLTAALQAEGVHESADIEAVVRRSSLPSAEAAKNSYPRAASTTLMTSASSSTRLVLLAFARMAETKSSVASIPRLFSQ